MTASDVRQLARLTQLCVEWKERCTYPWGTSTTTKLVFVVPGAFSLSPNHLYSPRCYTVFIVQFATRDDHEIVERSQRRKGEHLPQMSKMSFASNQCSNSINGHAQPCERCAELELTCTKADGADNPLSSRLPQVSVIVIFKHHASISIQHIASTYGRILGSGYQVPLDPLLMQAFSQGR